MVGNSRLCFLIRIQHSEFRISASFFGIDNSKGGEINFEWSMGVRAEVLWPSNSALIEDSILADMKLFESACFFISNGARAAPSAK